MGIGWALDGQRPASCWTGPQCHPDHWLHLMATLGPYLGLTISPPSLQACSHSTVFLDRHLQTTGHT